MTGSEMKSTRIPSRMRPISAVTIPANNERHTATSGPVISGCASVTFDTAWPTSNETTAIPYQLVSSHFFW